MGHARLGQLKSFGGYVFPERSLSQFNDNFANIVPVTVRFPGMSGGWSEDGQRRGSSQIGSVQANWYLAVQDEMDMDLKREAVRAMAEYGQAKLVYQPTDGRRERFCLAQIQNISDPHRAGMDEYLATVSAVWQVMYPRWLDGEYLTPTASDGVTVADSIVPTDYALALVCSGTSTSHTVENEGNASAFVALAVIPGTANTCENPTIKRVIGAATQEEISWTGVLSDEDELYVDGQRRLATVNAVNALADFSYQTAAFLTLAPGENTITVEFENGGDDATVYLWYAHTYQ